jgi:hypothetical protein
VKKFERSQLSHSPDVLAIFFVAIERHTISCKAFVAPRKSTSLCERQRQRQRETHTHTHPAILQCIFMGGTIPHYCEREKEREREREILEFCIEELELDCKM